jgi:hypothetical protein
MTPASLLRVLEGLAGGTRLLSGSQREQIDDNCLGWDCSIAGQAEYRGEYGGFGVPGSAGLQIFFGILAGTIRAVIAANSNGLPLQTVVQTALQAATHAPSDDHGKPRSGWRRVADGGCRHSEQGLRP